MIQNFFDELDQDWGDVLADIYNSDIITIEPEIIGCSDKAITKKAVDKYDLKNVKHIIIAEGTEIIDAYVFKNKERSIGKTNIKTVKFPTTLRTIGDLAFNDITSLESIELNSNIESIDWFAFGGCINLKNVKINGFIKNIDGYAFENCNITGELKLPEGLKSIGENAFFNNKNITKVVFPEGLETIGNNAFKNCINITGDVIIPKSVNYISYTALTNCNNIKRIFISKEKHYGWHKGFYMQNKSNNTEFIYY